MTRCLLLLLSTLSLGAAEFKLPAITALPSTNQQQGHLIFVWDTVTNALWYSVIVRSNGIETQRRYSMTNSVVVSNLYTPLDQYRFTAIATNSLGESDESVPATLHWMTVLESDSLNGPWKLLVTNQFVPSAPQHFIALSNWNAENFLKKD